MTEVGNCSELLRLSTTDFEYQTWTVCLSLVDEGWYLLTAVTVLSSFLPQTPYRLFWVFWAEKTFTTHLSGGRVQAWVQVKPLPVIWQSLPGLVWLASTLPSAQTQGGSQSAAVAAGHYLLACGKRATTLAILTQCESKKKFQCFVNIGPQQLSTSHFFCQVKWNFRWNRQEVVADQSSAHSFAQSFVHSLVSEWKCDMETKQHVNPVQSSRCSDSNLTQLQIAQQLQIAVRKSLERCLAWFWIDCNQSLQLNWSQLKCDVAM